MQNITLITGSTLGGAEYVGDHLSDLMTQENIPVDVINEAKSTTSSMPGSYC